MICSEQSIQHALQFPRPTYDSELEEGNHNPPLGTNARNACMPNTPWLLA